ncbi:prolyl oligopeptidase family serine peptidase [Edaphobacter flagellatus]|uniref:prolyl oligopeptidase family serine peptidase n=1 Tax=Edaphobacter flagellatus TaxID=1933044 RepID=UPI0021B43AA5|nr:prolyl oligopeptidase family serine peptidase [Edaphobacter flagellatus]
MSLTATIYRSVEEIIHGVNVSDPYRWLEDRSLPETEEWIREQQRRCDVYFAECNDMNVLREEVMSYLDAEVVDQPVRTGDRYFYRRRNSGMEQACIYVRDAITGVETLLVDPSRDGPFVSVDIHSIASDGSLLAYKRKYGGEDKNSIHIVDVETGVERPGHLSKGLVRGFAFTQDKSGFFYCQEASATRDDHFISLRRLDESVADQVVFRAARSNGSRLVLTADEVHLGAIWMREVNGELIEDFWIARQEDPVHWHQIFSNKPLPFSPILRNGRVFAISEEGAANRRLIELDPDGKTLRTIVPEQKGTMRGVVFGRDTVYALFLNEMQFELKCWSLEGTVLPDIVLRRNGTVHLIPTHGNDGSLFLSYESFAQPPILFEYLTESRELKVWNTRIPSQGPSDYVVRDESYPAIDGTSIPITLVSALDAPSTSPRPVIMTGYGGFGVPMTPQFSVLVSIMLKLGTVFALPHIRGGGEFGKAWHEAARGSFRQVAFGDFLSAAEWMCEEKITSPTQLAIFGGSNSGLLVGVAMTQRPDLFQAVFCVAPLLDMVRYESFDEAAKWRREYGTVDDPEQFAAIYAYSPYHHVQANTNYPSVLFVSGDRDDRCNPAHVRKMAARLQESTKQCRPIVVDYSEERGHAPALPLSVRVDALARRIVFLCRELNLPIYFGGDHDALCV